VEDPLFLSDFNEILIFVTDFRKCLIYQVSSKSVQWDLTCFMQTDMMKLTDTFHNFVNVPKKGWKAIKRGSRQKLDQTVYETGRDT
jgi:hypothetical protein